MERPKKKVKYESMSYFEMQEQAWYENDCQGDITDYDGTEINEYN